MGMSHSKQGTAQNHIADITVFGTPISLTQAPPRWLLLRTGQFCALVPPKDDGTRALPTQERDHLFF